MVKKTELAIKIVNSNKRKWLSRLNQKMVLEALYPQYLVNYNLPKGLYLTSAPILTANWENNRDDRWTVPFGGGIGKIFKISSNLSMPSLEIFNLYQLKEDNAY